MKVGNWATGCDINVRDPYGKKVEDDHCWVLGGSHKNEFENALPMTSEIIFVVDNKGGRLYRAKKISDLCGPVPRRVAVDGVRIDTLPADKQVETVLQGSVLIREQARPWPYCNLANYGTRLDGIAEAYAMALAMWQERKPN
ncbi:hypothetical protein WDZ92_34735 [Nostoc sp. NIES-2111]